MRALNSLRGKLIEVEFLDHALEGPGEKNDELMTFKVWGKVQSLTEKVLIVKTWELQNGDQHTKKKNNEIAKILVPSIINIRFLELMEEIPIFGH